MYIVHKETNSVEAVAPTIFSKENFSERYHLQEWISKEPSMLGEDLLIIQKEFDGFDDTKERLDLLALDSNGNLVIIENKLDDSGRDVVWQAIKYASYCYQLSGSEIINLYEDYLANQGAQIDARSNLEEFLGLDYENILTSSRVQRIILVAAKFRKEVTSTVLWLAEYGIQVKCIKVTLHNINNQLLLEPIQILPVPEAEEYMIKLASKQREQAEEGVQSQKYRDFWIMVRDDLTKKSDLTIPVTNRSWFYTSTGIPGLNLNMSTTQKYIRVELYIRTKDNTKDFFDYLFSHREDVESRFGTSLEWERLDNRYGTRIKTEWSNINVFELKDTSEAISYLTKHFIDFNDNLLPIIKDYHAQYEASTH